MADIDRAIDEAERLFESAAEARAEAENADERRKQIEALMFIKHKDAGCSAAEAERRAKADPEYRQAADDWMSANITWRRLDGKARGKELRFEAWRKRFERGRSYEAMTSDVERQPLLRLLDPDQEYDAECGTGCAGEAA